MSFGPSGFVKSIKLRQEKHQHRNARVLEVVQKCKSLPPSKLPPLKMINKIGSDDVNHFVQVMTSIFHEMVNRFNLQPDSRVLDIGCGCGRLAIPFAFLLDKGCYHGLDVWKEGIEWCRRNIAVENRAFFFHCLQSSNNYYFDERRPSIKNDYSLPFIEKGSIDLVFGISVFTHLVEHDVQTYLSEITRVLDVDGKVYLSCFVIDEYFFRYVEETGLHKAVTEAEQDTYYAYSGQDFFAGYSLEKWQSMFAEHDLKAVSFEVGSWANKPGARPYQDLFILVRK